MRPSRDRYAPFKGLKYASISFRRTCLSCDFIRAPSPPRGAAVRRLIRLEQALQVLEVLLKDRRLGRGAPGVIIAPRHGLAGLLWS